MKQSYYIYLFALLISMNITSSDALRVITTRPNDAGGGGSHHDQQLPDGFEPAEESPSSSNASTPLSPPTEQLSVLEKIERDLKNNAFRALAFQEAVERSAKKREQVKQKKALQAIQEDSLLKNNPQEDSSFNWGVTATSATVAGAAASGITYLVKGAQSVPTRGVGDLLLDSTTGGMSTGVTAAVYGGITIATVGTLTAIVVSIKKAWAKLRNKIQESSENEALRERHHNEDIQNLQNQIDQFREFFIDSIQTHRETMQALLGQHESVAEDQTDIKSKLTTVDSKNNEIINGIALLGGKFKEVNDAKDHQATQINSLATQVQKIELALQNKKDKKDKKR